MFMALARPVRLSWVEQQAQATKAYRAILRQGSTAPYFSNATDRAPADSCPFNVGVGQIESRELIACSLYVDRCTS